MAFKLVPKEHAAGKKNGDAQWPRGCKVTHSSTRNWRTQSHEGTSHSPAVRKTTALANAFLTQ